MLRRLLAVVAFAVLAEGRHEPPSARRSAERGGSPRGRSLPPLAWAHSTPAGFFSRRASSQRQGGRVAAASPAQRPPARVARNGVVRMQEVDLYGALGVGRGASDSDIKKAYRSAARKWHPDVNQEAGAKEKFQEISEAYSVLSDPNMRQRYDQFGIAGVRQGAGGGPGPQDFDIGDIFESFFGGGGGPGGGRRRSGPTQGDDLRFDLEIDFQTALFGGSKKIRITHLETCGQCTGSGVAPGSSVNSCGTCGGRGVVVTQVNTILGRMQQQARCPTCGGTGTVVEKYCGDCDGRGVQIPGHARGDRQIDIVVRRHGGRRGRALDLGRNICSCRLGRPRYPRRRVALVVGVGARLVALLRRCLGLGVVFRSFGLRRRLVICEIVDEALDLCQPPFDLCQNELVLRRIVFEGSRLALREGSFRILQPYQCGVPPVAAIRQLVQFSTDGREPARVARAAQEQRFEVPDDFMLGRRRRGE